MATLYTVAASACPILVVSAALHEPDSLTPRTFFSQQPGVPSTMTTGLRSNAVMAENIARYSGGAYAIVEGLELDHDTGLLVDVLPGVAMLDGPVFLADGYEGLALTDNVRNWIWLLHTGTLSVVPTSLTPPSDACCCLGSILTSGGTMSGSEDGSGRYQLRGPGLYRRTGDVGLPGDTPSARVAFTSVSTDGRYLWDGVGWNRIDGPVSGWGRHFLLMGA